MNVFDRTVASFCFLLCLSVSSAAHAAGKGIVFWHNRQASDVVAAICERFTKQTGIPVEINWIAQANYKPSLLRHAADGDPPDVALVAGDFLGIDKELKFSEVPETLQAKGILKNALQAGIYEGRMLGAPVTWGSHLMLFYNRDHVSKPARTFAELEQQAVEFKSKGIRPLGMNFGEMYWLVPFLGAYGGWPIDEKGELTLKTPATAQALDFYFGLANKGLTLKDCRNDCALDRFAKGEFAYAMGGDWMVRDLEEKMEGKLGIATLPLIDKRPLVPMFSSYLLTFPNNALNGPKREELLKFLRYMQSPEVQRRWSDEAKVWPVSEKIFKEVSAKANENRKNSLEQLRQARAMPNDRNMAFAWEGMAKGFSALYNGRVNAEQSASIMQNYAEKMAKRDGP